MRTGNRTGSGRLPSAVCSPASLTSLRRRVPEQFSAPDPPPESRCSSAGRSHVAGSSATVGPRRLPPVGRREPAGTTPRWVQARLGGHHGNAEVWGPAQTTIRGDQGGFERAGQDHIQAVRQGQVVT